MLVFIGMLPTLCAGLFWQLGDAYDFLTPIEAKIAPTFFIGGLLFTLAFWLAPYERLLSLFAMFKILGGACILAGLIHGALSYESHIGFFLMWLPVYYVGAIFAAATSMQRLFGKIYFAVSTVSVLSALWLGPLELIHEHSIFLVSSVLSQFVLVWVFYFVEGRMRKRVEFQTKMVAAQKEAEAHERSAEQAKRELEISESANRAKSSFIANMSHELRTPLNAMIGFSQILKAHKETPVKDEKIVEYSNDIESSAQHLLSLINDILDLSKIEAGKVDLAHDKLKLCEVFDHSVRLIAPTASEKDIKIDTVIPDGFPRLIADQRALRQIMVNLLSNAVKFTHDGGQVKLEAGQDTDSEAIIIKIRDNGAGMSAETLKRVMQPFEQGEVVYARQNGGTGLGLSLVKALAELQDAYFCIESEEWRGTTVTLRFPPSQTAA
jgi:signal transduction histidine kinase